MYNQLSYNLKVPSSMQSVDEVKKPGAHLSLYCLHSSVSIVFIVFERRPIIHIPVWFYCPVVIFHI